MKLLHTVMLAIQLKYGGDDRTRTDNNLLAKQELYQLSYIPMKVVGRH